MDKPQGPIHRLIPPGEDRERLVCRECGFILYQNPRIVVGTVSLWEEQVLLIRRDIEPRRGYWSLPAGFLEIGERAEDGASRETREEAGAEVEVEGLLAVYTIPRVSQVHLFYRSRLRSPGIAAGKECTDARLFAWEEIPWGEMAFPSATWALRHARAVWGRPLGAAFTNPEGEDGDLTAFVARQEQARRP
jgi:ADP-ribose pyrophosphatase YjhB (NUDIX family)